MKILVVDQFLNKRDSAQTDMYKIMSEDYDVTFTQDVFSHLLKGDYDVLYLGIYHQSLNIDWQQVFRLNTKPVVIDQADNEEFLDKHRYAVKNLTVLSRYLPHKPLELFCEQIGARLLPLNWYVNPERFYSQEKTCDVAFIGSMHGGRDVISKNVEYVCKKNGWTYIAGEYYEDYAELLSKTRVMVIECARKCLTQKYIEARLSGMFIIGDTPEFPINDVRVIQENLYDVHRLEDAIRFATELPTPEPTMISNIPQGILRNEFKTIFNG